MQALSNMPATTRLGLRPIRLRLPGTTNACYKTMRMSPEGKLYADE